MQADGSVVERRFITLMWVMDERICDGFYYSTAIKYIRGVLRNPFVLDERPEQIIEDVD